MARFGKYIVNPETLMYEIKEEPRSLRILLYAVLTLLGLGLVWFYFWMYTSVLGLELPKTAHLRKVHAEWESRMEVMNRQLDLYEETLGGIEDRDDDVYRSIFGLDPIPENVKQAGFGGVNRYAYLDDFGANANLKSTIRRMDVLTKRVYLQSRALDEVGTVSREAGDMIACIPAVPPLCPDPGRVQLSSPFGYRTDPVYGGTRFHSGQDFSTSGIIGIPVYATGDGVVTSAKYQFTGYGNELIINHGFGYETRYAHLNTIEVGVGTQVHRGDLIGTVGKSGKATGPHLHYEVLLRGAAINPYNYMDMSISREEYQAMVEKREAETEAGKRTTTGEILRRRRTVGQ
ncbi:MAG: M23 family metallopeptidase [Bacteroidales bacterium]|nr:M23 family metallopeptidase [Bacteroidales bacterium]